MAIESKLTRGPIGRLIGEPGRKKSYSWLWIVVVFILVVAGAIWWYRSSVLNTGEDKTEIGTGKYQAVFVDNGQVYFGKLNKSGDDFFQLTDVFYLQAGTIGLDQTSNLSLVKLGNEAHGPEDKMQINKDHVLFIEDMKSDSKVVKAIQDYKLKK